MLQEGQNPARGIVGDLVSPRLLRLSSPLTVMSFGSGSPTISRPRSSTPPDRHDVVITNLVPFERGGRRASAASRVASLTASRASLARILQLAGVAQHALIKCLHRISVGERILCTDSDQSRSVQQVSRDLVRTPNGSSSSCIQPTSSWAAWSALMILIIRSQRVDSGRRLRAARLDNMGSESDDHRARTEL